MADNTTLPGTGDIVAADDVGGIKYQRVKVSTGADGTAVDNDATHPIYIDKITGGDLVAGASIGVVTETAPASDTASSGLNGRLQRIAQRISSLITLWGAATDAKNVATDTTSLTFMQVFKQISASVQTIAAGGGGSAVTMVDGANATLGAKADAKAATSDATPITAMQVLKQISFSIQAVATALAGSLTVGTHGVTIADNANVTFGAKADAKSIATDTTAVSAMSVFKQISASVQALVSTGIVITNANGNGAAVAASSAPVVLANDTGLLAVAHTAAPTAKTDGQVVPFVADKVGKLVTVHAIRDLVVSSGVVTLTGTGETTLLAAVASTFLDMTAIKLNNTSATPVRVDIRDATGGTVIDTFYLPAGDVRGQSYPVPKKQTAVNTNWTIQLSGAVTDVRVVAEFVKNI
jgi:hypothetical protein